jgi:hypothetical protein
MPGRRGVASLALLPLILVASMLGFGVQTAGAVSLDQVTGGQSGLFVPLTNVQQLGQKGIFVSPISPAYLTFTLQEGPAVRFPITDGAVESSTMLGTVNHAGGLSIQKFNPDGTKAAQLDVTDIKIVAGSELVGNALGIVPAPTADLVHATWSKDATTGVITYAADAQLNAVTATVLNTYFSTDAFSPGQVLGRLKSTIQTHSIL